MEAQIEIEGHEILMATLYLTEQYNYVKLDGESLRIQGKNTQPGHVVRIPLNKIEQIVVLGDITLSTGAIQALLERRIAVHYLSIYGKSYGALLADWGKNSGVRLAQYRCWGDSERSFAIAKQCIAGKLINMRTITLRYARNRDDGSAISAATDEIQQSLRQLARLRAPSDTSDRMHGLGPLLGIEGNASAAYYRVFGAFLKGDWEFAGRVKRPPTDPVNALLSFGYSLLTNQVVSLIHAVGLDPGLGVLHQPGFGKPALALDLMEGFRPIVVDSVVITLLNTGQIKTNDFREELGAYRLKDEARRTFIEKIENRMNETVQHPLFKQPISYRRCIEVQIRLFAKHIQGEIDYYPPFTVR